MNYNVSDHDNEPIMTDLKEEVDQPELPNAVRQRPWIMRFASVFGFASQGQGTGPAMGHSGGLGSM